MYRVLLAVDGADPALRAVRHVVALSGHVASMRVLLVNVQPPPLAGEVSNFVSGEEVAALHRRRGEEALAGARALLAGAGVAHDVEILFGRAAETVVERAARGDVDAMVIGASGHGRLGALVLGSVAAKVVHAAPVPVTVVP